jgi:uncharacterized protein YdbL (DUF1318 family)
MRHLTLCASLLAGCTLTTTKIIQIDRKSTLEQQFIGEYEELGDDLVTQASVRAQGTGLGRTGEDPHARALQARRIQAFYKDDLDRARTKGCVGEGNDGRVAVLPCEDKTQAPSPERLVAQENEARGALVELALSKSEVAVRDEERRLLWQALRRIVLESAPRNTRVQNNAGQWVAP